MCTFDVIDDTGQLVHQSFPGGRLYVVYTAFTTVAGVQQGQVLFSSSSDCGATWTHSRSLNPNPDVNGDGVVRA